MDEGVLGELGQQGDHEVLVLLMDIHREPEPCLGLQAPNAVIGLGPWSDMAGNWGWQYLPVGMMGHKSFPWVLITNSKCLMLALMVPQWIGTSACSLVITLSMCMFATMVLQVWFWLVNSSRK